MPYFELHTWKDKARYQRGDFVCRTISDGELIQVLLILHVIDKCYYKTVLMERWEPTDDITAVSSWAEEFSAGYLEREYNCFCPPTHEKLDYVRAARKALTYKQWLKLLHARKLKLSLEDKALLLLGSEE